MRKYLASFISLLVVGCTTATVVSDDNTEEKTASEMHFKDVGVRTSSGNLIDHGGKVLPTTKAYMIWWGTQTSFPTDAKDGIPTFFNGLTNSSFLGVSTQYLRGDAPVVMLGDSWVDTSVPPNHGPSVGTIVNEVCSVISNNNATPDPSGLYFVYTSNFPKTNYCAWHSYGSCNGTTIQVAYMPNVANVSGCNSGNQFNCNSYSQGTKSLVNVTSHELMETITDATASAWYDSSGSEIGDKCAWQFDSCVQLTNSSWQIQKEWSNNTSSCVQQ